MASDESWWVLSESALRSFLKRAHDGEDADLLMLELCANSDSADD